MALCNASIQNVASNEILMRHSSKKRLYQSIIATTSVLIKLKLYFARVGFAR